MHALLGSPADSAEPLTKSAQRGLLPKVGFAKGNDAAWKFSRVQGRAAHDALLAPQAREFRNDLGQG
jgi:hypothetical protein